MHIVQWKLVDCIWEGCVSWTLGPSALHEMLSRQKWEWSVRGIIAFDMLNKSWLVPVHCGFNGIGRSSQRCRLVLDLWPFLFLASFVSAVFLRIIVYPTSAKSSVWLLSSECVRLCREHEPTKFNLKSLCPWSSLKPLMCMLKILIQSEDSTLLELYRSLRSTKHL